MYEETGFAVVQRYSQWQKKNVRTIVVNAHAKNPSQKLIAEAVALAKPYDRIELTAGEYHETLAIQMPLELVAAEGEDPHISSRGATITIATSGVDVYFERIIVVSRSNSKLDYAFNAVAGKVTCLSCLFGSVLIGGNAVGTLNECTVEESNTGVGITIQDNGGGLVKSSTIRNHRNVCMDIDTRGELVVTDCSIENSTGGDCVSISTALSSVGRDSSTSYLSNSHVQVEHCYLSISEGGSSSTPTSGTAGGPSSTSSGMYTNISGSACCIVLSHGAAPIIAHNELREGEIGVLIEGPGTAQLKGNTIRLQRRCGILAIVEEGFGFSHDHKTLRITGDNLLDRCHVGIDVQCATSRASYLQQQGITMSATGAAAGTVSPAEAGVNGAANVNSMLNIDRFLVEDLPNPKRMFSWAPVQGTSPPSCSREAACFPSSQLQTLPTLVCMEGNWYALDKLKANIEHLITLTLHAYPTCLQPSFEVTAGAGPPIRNASSATSNPFAELLKETLGVQLSQRRDPRSVEPEMLQLRGNKGVDIVNTRFSNCDVCAIRFGRQGYGLVQECIFEDCGTFAIIVDCAAHPLITGCRFLRSRGASILVGNFGNPFIIGNEITSGKRDGIQLSRMSRGVIAGNIITTHIGVGIQVEKHSDPLICANFISQNRKGGLVVDSGSTPSIIFNQFTGNEHAQLSCTGSSDAFITHNTITSSTDAGIHIASCSRCTVLSNTISSNGYGLLIELDADPYVQDNDIIMNSRAGVAACDNALGVFVSNRILENAGPNIVLMEGSSSVFRANRIESSAQGGVIVCNEGHGFFECNTIASNAVANVLVAGAHTQPEFLHNIIADSRTGCGISCERSSGGKFLHNTIQGNCHCGIYIREASNPLFQSNTIVREVVGVLVSNGGRGSLMHNKIRDCYGIGVMTQQKADPVFSENQVTGCRMSGLHITPDSLGLFEKNELRGNDIGVQLGSSVGVAVVEVDSSFLESLQGAHEDSPRAMLRSSSRADLNRLTPSRSMADKSMLRSIADTSEQRQAYMARSTGSIVRGNTVTENICGGILLDILPNATLEENHIFQNNAYGVRGDVTYSAERTQAMLKADASSPRNTAVMQSLLVQKSDFSAGKLQSVMLIRANVIHDHYEANIFLDHFDGEQYPTTITENMIYNAPYGVSLANSSTLSSMSKNEIHTCADGFCFASGGGGCYTANHVHHCTYSGVYISDLSHPNFTDSNRIESCGFSGVLVDVSGRGVFRNNTIRHCMNGVVVFCGPTSPFHVPYEEIIKARILTSTPTFVENTIEENELHGVLLLSVISGYPLRSPPVFSSCDIRIRSAEASSRNPADEPSHDALEPFFSTLGGTVAARGDNLCAVFTKNTIQRNRIMGVYHDRFDHWDLAALEKVHAGRKPPNEKIVKNTYGGYETLLGTSQILENDEHRHQRQLKQVSLIENVITACSFGVGAGHGCHPYLEKNKIYKNTFFGLLLRFGSAVSACGNDICDNGLAGIYAANGAKGYIAKGKIESNNGWCRTKNTHSTSRSFRECPFSKSFFSPSVVKTTGEDMSTSTAATAEKPLRACRRAYEQMTLLTEVHTFTMTDALRFLAQLVEASSVGFTLASGCTPSTTFDLATGAPLNASIAAASSERLVGGLALSEYADVSTADGGIGVWVEAGSRVTIEGNEIRKHQNSGVLITRGLIRHHSLLHKWFGLGTTSTVSAKGKETTVSSSAGKPTQGALDDTAVNIFAVQLEAPPLASEEPGVLFTSNMLCANGILAAVQLATSTSYESLEASFASLLHHSISLASHTGPGAEDKKQQADPANHAHITDNVLSENTDGVHVEIFQHLQGYASYTPAVLAVPAHGTTLPFSGETSSMSSTLTPRQKELHVRHSLTKESTLCNSTAALIPANYTTSTAATVEIASAHEISLIDSEYNPLDFTIVVERNTITQNLRHGVYAVHVVDVHCGNWVSNRGALNEMISMPYRSIRSDLIQGGNLTGMSGALVFGVHPVGQKVGHALFQKNDIFGNSETQVFLTSRYVAVTGDGDRTLLQLDTCAPSLDSSYASEILIAVPVVASLLQRPPPGVMLWDENKIHDGKKGVRLRGYLGPRCVRFQRNKFFAIAEEALFLQGHLTYVTVGKGNLFDRSGVGIRIAQEQRVSLEASPATSLAQLRTLIFHNTFIAAKDSSIVLESTTEMPPLVFRNEFTGHKEGATALYFSSGISHNAAVIQGNVFSDNHTPVFLVGKKNIGDARKQSVPLITLFENRFTCNYVGIIVCNGAYPKLERNLFDNNRRAGLEVAGNGTRVLVRHCVFCDQLRDSSSTVRSTGASADEPKLQSNSTATESTTRFLTETISLKGRKLSLPLLAETARVLSATSQDRLPAGMRIGPFTETVVDSCSFVNNDIGVDALRDALSPAGSLAELKTQISGCLFSKHHVCGVLVRGAKGPGGGGGGGGGRATKGTVDNRTVTSDPADVSTSLISGDKTVFEHCVFKENSTTDGFGDVIAMEGGCATFRNSIFGGTVIGKMGGQAFFTQSHFVALSEGDLSTLSGSLLDTRSGDSGAATAVVIQEGGRIVVEQNTIAHRKVGVHCMPGAEGTIAQNCILQCLTGLLLGPFNRTDVTKNRVLDTAECGVIAHGGQMTNNTIMKASVGFFAQPSSLYKGINAVPSHKRDALELFCTRNTIVGCTDDGLLITAAGNFDGNTISHCKNGIRVTPPPKSAVGGSPPMIKNCNVYDNVTGVFLENDSVSVVRDNHIFDNEALGLLVATTATGTVQDNHISSATDQGAAEMPTELQLKVIGNVIRNQFSPAFQRGTRLSRAKEYQQEHANLERELRDLNQTVEEAHQNMETVAGGMRSLHRELVKMYSRSIADFAAGMSGSAGRALRVASAETARAKTSASGSMQEGNSTPALCTTVGELANLENSTVTIGAPAPRKRSSINSRRATSATSRRDSLVSTGSRKSSKTDLKSGTRSRTKSLQSLSLSNPKPVLVHVFTAAETGTNPDAIGQTITGILAKAPLSKHNFVPTISTSITQLHNLLGPPHPIVPYLCIVVLDADCGTLSPIEHQALHQLHKIASDSVGDTTDTSNRFYTVLPRLSFTAHQASSHVRGSMNLEEYASAHHPFTYTASLEEVLDDLHDQITKDVRASSAAEANKHPWRTPVSSRRTSHVNKTSEGKAIEADERGCHITAEKHEPPERSHEKGKGPTFLTTEHIGALFSQLTPEAFGFEPQKAPRSTRKRKGSVSFCVTDENEGGTEVNRKHRSKRGSKSSRKNSTAASSTTSRSRRSSVSSIKSGHRETSASKKA